MCSLLDAFSDFLGQKERSQFPKLEAYFTACVDMPQFKAVLQGKGRKLCNASPMSFSPAPRAQPQEQQPQKQQQAPKAAPKQATQPRAAPAPKQPAAPAAAAPAGAQGTPEDHAALAAIKEKVRDLKANGAAKADVDVAIVEMKRLKEVCGEVDPPKKKKK